MVDRDVQPARDARLRPNIGTELVHQQHRAVLLGRFSDGYANLCRILSARHCDGDFQLIHAVTTYRHGLIILSDDQDALRRSLCGTHPWRHDASGAGLQPNCLRSRPPARFLHPKDHGLHRILRVIALNTTLSRLPAEACASPTQWFMTPAELERQFPHVPHALSNTLRIAERCQTD